MDPKIALDEQQLLAAIAAGDRRSFERLFRSRHVPVLGFARRLLRSEELAREVVQEVFLKLWLNRERLAGVENFGGYLNTVVRNECLKVFRQRSREVLNLGTYGAELSELDLSTEQQLDYREASEILDRAVKTLSPRQLAVYELCHRQGLSYAEAAQQLGLSPQTVHSYMKDALRKIRLYFRDAAIGYVAFILCLFH